MRNYLWLPFIVAVSVVPGFWASAASGAEVDIHKNGQAVSSAGSGLAGGNGTKVVPMTPGRAELKAKHYERRSLCYASPRIARSMVRGSGCGVR